MLEESWSGKWIGGNFCWDGGGEKLEKGGGAAIIRGVNSEGQCKNYLLGWDRAETSRVWKV